MNTSLILLFLLVAAPIGRPANRSDLPAVVCRSPYYYVGTTEKERVFEVDRVFRVANLSSAPLSIASAEASCSCSKESRKAYDIQYDPEIPARSEIELRIGYRTAPVAGVPDIREFQVRFRDNQAPPVSLTVLAKRLDQLTVFPGADLILRQSPGKPAEMKLYLVARDRKPLRVEPALPSVPGLTTRVTPVTEAEDLQLPAAVWENGSVVELWIKADPLAHGKVAQLRLKSNQPDIEEIVLKVAVF